ncbi:MAG: ABC transporter substrate-binding protein [Rhodobacteraceae bacterium]|nr:ABC transporter substrate-binding protein [Paracoccaceae bacterium]MCY4327795.1 ABC transporter substrate-binding protein [Paracoccaceae bacterium]
MRGIADAGMAQQVGCFLIMQGTMTATGRACSSHRVVRVIFAGVLAVVAMLFFCVGSQASEKSAVSAVERINDSIASLLNDYETHSDDGQLRDGFQQVLARSLDTAAISQSVLGVAWRQASKEQRAQFQDAFVAYLAKKYSRRFPDFVGAEFVVTGTKTLKDNHFVVYVDTTIGSTVTKVEWYVLRRRGRSQVVNIALGDTNILGLERKVIRSLLQQRGGDLDKLIAYLPLRN